MEYSERLVRVEESIKNSIKLTQQGFNLMEKRFEQMDKRFEQVDKRFELMQISIDKRFENVETKLSELSRRMFQFMV